MNSLVNLVIQLSPASKRETYGRSCRSYTGKAHFQPQRILAPSPTGRMPQPLPASKWHPRSYRRHHPYLQNIFRRRWHRYTGGADEQCVIHSGKMPLNESIILEIEDIHFC